MVAWSYCFSLKAFKNIGEDIGDMAFFLDTEGNKIALHSQN